MKHTVVPVGQAIYLMRNIGGGDWKIWVNGVTDEQYIPSGPGYCTGEKQSSDECAITVVEQILHKQMGPPGRDLVALASEL